MHEMGSSERRPPGAASRRTYLEIEGRKRPCPRCPNQSVCQSLLPDANLTRIGRIALSRPLRWEDRAE